MFAQCDMQIYNGGGAKGLRHNPVYDRRKVRMHWQFREKKYKLLAKYISVGTTHLGVWQCEENCLTLAQLNHTTNCSNPYLNVFSFIQD